VAAIEKTPAAWSERFLGALHGFRFLPGGRILAGAGTTRVVTPFNCFVMGLIDDSIEGIFEPLKEGHHAAWWIFMNTRRASKIFLRNLIASMVIAGATGVFAADEPPAPPSAPSKEVREQMAALHEKMAACLRSDKAFAACRDEMQKSCWEMMGEQGCPMMGMGMHDRMMKPSP
jgi:hypothetical protein